MFDNDTCSHAPGVTLVTGPGFIYIRIKAEARDGHRLFSHHSAGIFTAKDAEHLHGNSRFIFPIIPFVVRCNF